MNILVIARQQRRMGRPLRNTWKWAGGDDEQFGAPEHLAAEGERAGVDDAAHLAAHGDNHAKEGVWRRSDFAHGCRDAGKGPPRGYAAGRL